MGIKIETSDEGKNKVGSEESKNQIKNLVDRIASLEKIIKEKEQVIEHQNTMLKMMTQFVEEIKKKNK
jgi:hypothetical protein